LGTFENEEYIGCLASMYDHPLLMLLASSLIFITCYAHILLVLVFV
jgi:hypothetical protein